LLVEAGMIAADFFQASIDGPRGDVRAGGCELERGFLPDSRWRRRLMMTV